jgi:uncharacterized membrane protein YeaQ/YmgE (transglycosylase-associated protein family)
MLSWVWWLIVGLVVGALARFLLPGRDPMGLIATMILGIVGSLIGGVISSFIWRTDTGFHAGGFIMSLLGAILVLWIWRMVRSRTTT